MRVVPFLLVCVLCTAARLLLAQDAASAAYRDIASLYRTAPDEAVSRVLQLAPAARENGITDALKSATRWQWDDLAAAAMLETDAALTHLPRDDAAGAPHLDAAERLLLRGLQAAPQQIAFVTRWYRGVAAVVYVVTTVPPPATPDRHLYYRSGIRLTPDADLDDRSSFLREIAQRTGGDLLITDPKGLPATFERIVGEFRRRYLVSYMPSGVEAGGWHAIDVTLQSRRGKVTARRGYQR